MRTLLLLAATILLLDSDAASAQVPQLLSYQGVLTDNLGIIVPDGTHDLTFRIFNVDVAGAALFTETQTGLPVVRGGFSAVIGGVAPLTLPFDAQYWLEIQVDADAPLVPRVKLTSAPYALMAKTVPDGAITSAKIADGTVQPIDLRFGVPGVASATEGLGAVTLNATVQTILSRAITIPATIGYVLVWGTAQVNVFHTSGTATNFTFGVSDAAGAFPVNQDVALLLPSTAPTGTYVFPVTVHGLFEVLQAANTFYFLGTAASGSGSVNDMQLSMIFAPYAYGTVEPTEVGKGASAIEDIEPSQSLVSAPRH